MNGSGNMIWAPLKADLNAGEITEHQIWLTLHEFGHSLLEGVHSLYMKGGLPTETDRQLHEYTECLHAVTPDLISPELDSLVRKAADQTNPSDVGKTMREVTDLVC